MSPKSKRERPTTSNSTDEYSTPEGKRIMPPKIDEQTNRKRVYETAIVEESKVKFGVLV
jgi:hypothetical protein